MKDIKNYLFILLLANLFIFTSFAYSETNEKNVKIKSIGEYYSKFLMSNLKKELKNAIKQGGVINAISVCSKKALKITENIPKKCDAIKIKRTTFKYRNPKNKPTDYEKEALNYFISHKKERFYIQKIKINNKIYYNYYKKLTVVGICLKCHGNIKRMNKRLIKKLKELYPNDKAVNYKAGDFRGVIEVSIPEYCLK